MWSEEGEAKWSLSITLIFTLFIFFNLKNKHWTLNIIHCILFIFSPPLLSSSSLISVNFRRLSRNCWGPICDNKEIVLLKMLNVYLNPSRTSLNMEIARYICSVLEAHFGYFVLVTGRRSFGKRRRLREDRRVRVVKRVQPCAGALAKPINFHKCFSFIYSHSSFFFIYHQTDTFIHISPLFDFIQLRSFCWLEFYLAENFLRNSRIKMSSRSFVTLRNSRKGQVEWSWLWF